MAEDLPAEPGAKAPPRPLPIFGGLAILFLASGFCVAAYELSGSGSGLEALGIMVAAVLSFLVGCSLAVVAALVGLIRKERWKLLHLIVLAISLVPTFWLAQVTWDGNLAMKSSLAPAYPSSARLLRGCA